MKKNMQPDADVKLLERACPSIRYRIRSEVLGQPESSQMMVGLQAEILRDPLVVQVLHWRQADGWLGWSFHGKAGMEAGIRILCEKGVQRHHPALEQALDALEKYPERLERGIGKVGKILDEKGFGGSWMIRAAVFAYAGVENKAFLQAQIWQALNGFKAVLATDSIDDIVDTYRGKLVFKNNVQWPGIYHLRLLAFTHSWRSEENQKMVAEGVRRLIKLSPLPNISVRSKSQLMAPASFCMHDFNPEMGLMDDAHWMMWFHRMECLARLGVINAVPELQRQVEALARLLDADGYFTKSLSHSYFTKWGAYPGMMLETNWRTPERRVVDLTFRSMLILHYATGQAA